MKEVIQQATESRVTGERRVLQLQYQCCSVVTAEPRTIDYRLSWECEVRSALAAILPLLPTLLLQRDPS